MLAHRVILVCALTTVIVSGCGLLGAPPEVPSPAPAATPTLLPPPKPLSPPETGAAVSPAASPVSEAPTAIPTPIPPPDLNPAAPSEADTGERAIVANTDGQGANMRAEPSPDGMLVRTVAEGAELELIGEEREGGGRQWRNVRDPASGESGWIVIELLTPVAADPAPTEPTEAPAAASEPPDEPDPPAEPKPDGAPKPPESPVTTAPAGAARPSTRIGEADRAYLSVLQTQVDILGDGITSANEQIERAGGRPEILSDPTWQQDTTAVAQSLSDAAAKIRAASPGPATGEVHRFAGNAADRADEAAEGLTAAIESNDARTLNGVRTTLVRLLAEINNMNLTLLDLQ